MPKIWVLDTDTKGTGAEMVPLEKVLRKPDPKPEPRFVASAPEPRAEREPEPKPPASFRVIDVMTREVLAERAGTRETVELLEGTRSVVDGTSKSGTPRRRSGTGSPTASARSCGSSAAGAGAVPGLRPRDEPSDQLGAASPSVAASR
jgi:hypothetical protein